MPIIVHWDDERQSIIRWDFSGEWTWAESTQAAEITHHLLAESSDTEAVAILLDMAGMQTIPRDSLRNMRQLFHGLRPNDLVILCGDSVAVNVMIAFLRSIYRSAADQLFTTPTLDAGRLLALQKLAGYNPDDPTQSRRPHA
jgi:hypothetical protein